QSAWKRFGSRMNSTTSMSSPRTSSTPATSVQLVEDLAPRVMFAGVVRGIIPRVFQSTQATKPNNRSRNTGAHVVAKLFSQSKKCPTILRSHRQQGWDPLAE